eukprot:CAMPEP_0168420462 /NCGR_PEP_ID=MMETSP0228-20121227/32787_1 /TAXON_ID=133427 /ORGANISM="Protoceratium reticulatum, Strain CCCM 535 (=CCMP 1889)" /LENGTH=129 /DNA_ID=CAMNT_0008434357 /DNA_START=154 /DNA_END=541 /DNA_ORIENTATION=+
MPVVKQALLPLYPGLVRSAMEIEGRSASASMDPRARQVRVAARTARCGSPARGGTEQAARERAYAARLRWQVLLRAAARSILISLWYSCSSSSGAKLGAIPRVPGWSAELGAAPGREAVRVGAAESMLE